MHDSLPTTYTGCSDWGRATPQARLGAGPDLTLIAATALSTLKRALSPFPAWHPQTLLETGLSGSPLAPSGPQSPSGRVSENQPIALMPEQVSMLLSTELVRLAAAQHGAKGAEARKRKAARQAVSAGLGAAPAKNPRTMLGESIQASPGASDHCIGPPGLLSNWPQSSMQAPVSVTQPTHPPSDMSYNAVLLPGTAEQEAEDTEASVVQADRLRGNACPLVWSWPANRVHQTCSQGWWLSNGSGYGCNYLCYPHDPNSTHATHLVKVEACDSSISCRDLVGLARVAESVKKTLTYATALADGEQAQPVFFSVKRYKFNAGSGKAETLDHGHSAKPKPK
eukprot:gene5915-1055_t